MKRYVAWFLHLGCHFAIAFSYWRTVRRTVQADTFLVGLLAYDKMRG
jgi:hypothetical protein